MKRLIDKIRSAKKDFNFFMGAGVVLFCVVSFFIMFWNSWKIYKTGVYTVGEVVEIRSARRGIYVEIQFSLEGKTYFAKGDVGEWEDGAKGVKVLIRVQRDNPEGYFQMVPEGKIWQCLDTVPYRGWEEIPPCMGTR